MKATEPHRASAAGSILPSMTSWIVAVESVCEAIATALVGASGVQELVPKSSDRPSADKLRLKVRTENSMAETSILGTVDRWARGRLRGTGGWPQPERLAL